MREDADVATAGNRYACVEGLLKDNLFAFDALAAGDCQRRTQGHPTFFHQAHQLGR